MFQHPQCCYCVSPLVFKSVYSVVTAHMFTKTSPFKDFEQCCLLYLCLDLPYLEFPLYDLFDSPRYYGVILEFPHGGESVLSPLYIFLYCPFLYRAQLQWSLLFSSCGHCLYQSCCWSFWGYF